MNTHENRTPSTQQNYPTKPHNRTCPEHHTKLIGRGAPHGKGVYQHSRRVQPFAVQISVRFYLDIRYKIPNFDSVTKSNKTDLWKKSQKKKTGKGGAREGSGRKAVSGMYTKTMRVPTVMEEEVLCLIDMYSNWLKHGKMEKGMARRTTPEQRMRAIRSIQEILDYEKQSQKAHKQEEEDKRQLSLF